MSDRSPPRRCGARRKRGGVCTNYIMVGSDRGGKNGRCRFHGGLQMVLPPGDPRRGGRPSSSGLYRRHLDPSQLPDFDAVPMGNVDDEIRIARWNLDELRRQRAANPSGGRLVSITNKDGGKTVRIRPWDDIESEWIHRIDSLEKTRLWITQQTDVDDPPTKATPEDTAMAVVHGVVTGRIRGPGAALRQRAAEFLREDTVGKPIQRMKVDATMTLMEIIQAAHAKRTTGGA